MAAEGERCFEFELCCLATCVASLLRYDLFIATFVCFQNTEKKKKKKKKVKDEDEDWEKVETQTIGQRFRVAFLDVISLTSSWKLLTCYIAGGQGDAFDSHLLPWSRIPHCPCYLGRLLCCFAVSCVEKLTVDPFFHMQSLLTKNKNIFMEIWCLCLVTYLLAFSPLLGLFLKFNVLIEWSAYNYFINV